jgi:hypothetical protein
MTGQEWNRLLREDERVWLFNPGPESINHSRVRAYLKYGRETCDLGGYKLRTRDQWYEVPHIRTDVAGYLSGMSRLGPWICFRSKRQLSATNTLYVLIKKTKMGRDERAAWALSLLSSSPRQQFATIVRRYPDGLAKLEPHDVNSLKLPHPLRTRGASDAYEKAVGMLLQGDETKAVALADSFTRKP